MSKDNFLDETLFKRLTKFSGFSKGGTSPDNLVFYEASDGYYVSNRGEIWSCVYHERINPNSIPKKIGYMLGGYASCEIKLLDGTKKKTSVHRLVAEYWCEGFNLEDGKIIVNHIDENKTNNHPSNLEWVTQKQNMNSGTYNKRSSSNAKEWRKNNPEHKGKLRTAHREWARSNPEQFGAVIKKANQATSKPVALFTLEGALYKTFPSIAEAARQEGVLSETIRLWVKKRKTTKCGRFYWGRHGIITTN